MLFSRFSSTQIMYRVILALLPAMIAYTVLFGEKFVFNVLVANLTALIIEIIILKIRKQNMIAAFDGSGFVTATLMVLAIPIGIDFELLVMGVGVALILGKHIYGGLGHNIFNPAMIGFVFLLISFPVQMTDYSYFYSIYDDLYYDGISAATNLDGAKNNIQTYVNADTILIINSLYLLGGIYLLITRIISWHIPIMVLVGAGALSIILGESISFHLTTGGIILGAFFIATDGVSSPSSNNARIIYALLIGALIILIREFSIYPDGVAFAVLIANIFTPLLDYYFKDN